MFMLIEDIRNLGRYSWYQSSGFRIKTRFRIVIIERRLSARTNYDE